MICLESPGFFLESGMPENMGMSCFGGFAGGHKQGGDSWIHGFMDSSPPTIP